jgi:hypothetical protein
MQVSATSAEYRSKKPAPIVANQIVMEPNFAEAVVRQ